MLKLLKFYSNIGLDGAERKILFPKRRGGRIAAPLVKYWRRRPTLYTTRQLNPFRRPCAWWPNINSAELLTSGLFDASHFKHPSEESQLITIIER